MKMLWNTGRNTCPVYCKVVYKNVPLNANEMGLYYNLLLRRTFNIKGGPCHGRNHEPRET
jgi:hypothetical protein